MKSISSLKVSTEVKAPENWKDPKEEIPALRLTWELFVLAKDSALLHANSDSARTALCFYCSYAIPRIVPGTHIVFNSLPKLEKYPCLFPIHSLNWLDGNAGAKSEKEDQEFHLPLLILPSLSATGPWCKWGAQSMVKFWTHQHHTKPLHPCDPLGLGVWNNLHLNQVDCKFL